MAPKPCESSRRLNWIDHLFSRIDIQGIGTFNIVSRTRTFVNYDVGIVGYASNSSIPGQDLYDGPENSGFRTWHMLTSIGPVEGYAKHFQWGGKDVQTDAGVLFFDGDYLPTTFQMALPRRGSAGGEVKLGLRRRRRTLSSGAGPEQTFSLAVFSTIRARSWPSPPSSTKSARVQLRCLQRENRRLPLARCRRSVARTPTWCIHR